jgi:quercetin dioxygenase-like cupin family protein
VRIVSDGADQGHPVDRYGSQGLRAQALVRGGDAAVTVLRVAAGGEIGRHPAVSDQLFVVVAGRGAVSGGDGIWHAVEAGWAVIWDDGEEHSTRAEQDLTAVVVEMPGLGAGAVGPSRERP